MAGFLLHWGGNLLLFSFNNWSFWLGLLGSADVDLDWDGLTELTAFGSVEAQIELVEASFCVIVHSDWHGHFVGFHSVDFLLNWDVNKLDRHTALLNR